MDPHKLACMIVCPFLESTIRWADDTWAFRQWPRQHDSFWLEYLTFRELALERKKCLTIAQYIFERYAETRDARELGSMMYYLNQGSRYETYMNIMM